MLTKNIDVRHPQVSLPELVRWAREGADVVLSEGGEALARVVAIASTKERRTPGLHLGSMTATEDFDEPLGERFWTGE